jgi:transcription elongation factor Elf1
MNMGSRRRRMIVKPQGRTRSTRGRCPKCATIVKFNVTGQIGKEIYECTGCTTKFPIDQL